MYFAKTIVALTTCLVTIFPFFLGFAQHLVMRERNFYKMSDKSLVGNVTATMEVQDYFDCSFLCLEHGPSACLSFNVGKTNNNGYYTCELSNSERYLEPHRIQDRASYDYYGMTTKVSCKLSFPFFFLLNYIGKLKVEQNHVLIHYNCIDIATLKVTLQNLNEIKTKIIQIWVKELVKTWLL